MPRVTIEPHDINIDPEKGFTGFNCLPGKLKADEFLAIEWLIGCYQDHNSWVPIPAKYFIENVRGGMKTLEDLMTKDYVMLKSSSIIPTDLLIKYAYWAFPADMEMKPEELVAFEGQRLVKMVEGVFKRDKEVDATYLIVTRLYGAHGVCRRQEGVEQKLKAFGTWLDRGYIVIDLKTIDRYKPIKEQLPEIKWDVPHQETK